MRRVMDRGKPRCPSVLRPPSLTAHHRMCQSTRGRPSYFGVGFSPVGECRPFTPGGAPRVPVDAELVNQETLVASSRGIENENVAPGAFSFGSAQRRPPCFSMIERLTNSPTPITVLQLQQRAARAAVVRPLVVGKDRTRNDVRPHDDPYACAARAPSMWSVASLAASSGVLPRSRATT